MRPVVVMMALVLVAGCKAKERTEPRELGRRAPAPEEPTRLEFEPAPAGPAFAPRATMAFAIYHLPKPKTDPREALAKIVAKDYPYLTIAENADTATPPFAVTGEPSMEDYAPPSTDVMPHSSKGLSPEQAAAVQDSEHAFTVTFTFDTKTSLPHHRDAMKIMLELSNQTGGLLWDADTRDLFSAQAWSERITDWTDTRPKSWSLFAIYSYPEGQLLRMVSLGLGKFGLPDLVINNVPRSSYRSLGGLLNLTAETLLAGGAVGPNGTLDVDVAISPGEWTVYEGADGKGTITLAVGKREEGDADNRLWEIVFPGGPAAELHERQDVAIHDIFGSEDEIHYPTHDDELLAASARARVKLAGMKQEFQTAWPSHDRLVVKAPFPTDSGGTEWMWFEVLTWEGDTLAGLLQNDPYEVSGLKSGARVEAEFDSLFDYSRLHADGSETGNETGDIMTKQLQREK